MEPLAALLGIIGAFVVLAFIIARVEHRSFLAPSRSAGVTASAGHFCTERCREDGKCPVTKSTEQWSECPLWKYVAADVPTELHGSPFAQPA